MELHPEITYFNWYELISKARKDQSAILILTFAQTKLYNPYTTKGLMKALNINHIPVHLFSTGLLEQKKDKLICNYKTQEPMSYFKNPWFLTQNVSVLQKTDVPDTRRHFFGGKFLMKSEKK